MKIAVNCTPKVCEPLEIVFFAKKKMNLLINVGFFPKTDSAVRPP